MLFGFNAPISGSGPRTWLSGITSAVSKTIIPISGNSHDPMNSVSSCQLCFRYLEAFDEIITYSSAVFLEHCFEKFPYLIECVQTDNGMEFTNRLHSSGTAKLTLFEKTCRKFGIQHKLIKPCTPRHNGKVERSHRKDNEEFYASHTFYSFEDFKNQLAVRQRQYNNFPMRPLLWHSPKDTLSSFPNFVTYH